MGFFRSAAGRQQGLHWTAGSAADAKLDRIADQVVQGELSLSGKSSYLVLGAIPKKYAQIDGKAGIPVNDLELHVLSIDVDHVGKAEWAVLLMEYDDKGDRVGIHRYRRSGKFRYLPGANVSRILIALRGEGVGKLAIRELGWHRQTDLFERSASKGDQLEAMKETGSRRTKIKLLQKKKGIGPFTIGPNDFLRLCAFDLAPGRYEIQLHHRDLLFAENPEAISQSVFLEHPIKDGLHLPEPVLPGGHGDHASAAKSIGTPSSETFCHTIGFSVLEEQDWVVIALDLQLDRVVNIDSALIRPFSRKARDAFEGAPVREALGEFLGRQISPFEIQTIVYADVNLNKVDGSSVWLSSLLSILTSRGRCLLVSKHDIRTDIVLSNVSNPDRLSVLEPASIGHRGPFTIEQAVALLGLADECLPRLRNVIVRGCSVVGSLFASRRFKDRGFAYLTDFYEITDEGVSYPRHQVAVVRKAAIHAKALLTQSKEIENALRATAGRDFRSCMLPPAIPDDMGLPIDLSASRPPTLRIGYAGKINPTWGVVELLDWVERLTNRGIEVSLTIVANKIVGSVEEAPGAGFRDEILQRLATLGATLCTDLNRRQAMAKMDEMDFVWCWRPASLETNTLELSTKLVEMAARGARCICYPNLINCELLGEDYPFLVTNFDEFQDVVEGYRLPPATLAKRIQERFSMASIGDRLHDCCLNGDATHGPRLLVAGHGLKFVEPYFSALKADGVEVCIDAWHWGSPVNIEQSRRLALWADVILCEWGLANAAWYSRNLPPHKRLIVRIHAQEVRNKAQRLAAEIDEGRVEKFVFVSDRIRQLAIELFGWPEEKTTVVPNFLLDDEFRLLDAEQRGPITLGLLGIVPASKRFDRAIDLAQELTRRGHDTRLAVKGHRPEELSYMYAQGRISEMQFFAEQYRRLENDPEMKECVSFEPWGNDVAEWYRSVDFILSPSDHESFHYALADGVLSGCAPIIWPWDGAENSYPEDWLVADTTEAADRVEELLRLPAKVRNRERADRRAWLVGRYGRDVVFEQLDSILGIDR